MSDPGKLTQPGFEGILQGRLGHPRKEVLAGPAFGVDISLTDLDNGMAMACTSDPLSLIPSIGLKASAWLSVHLMANDMATSGFAPQYVQFVLNLPTWLSDSDFSAYWQYIHTFCESIGVAITGGHTGSIAGQDSTIAGGGTMITVAPKDRILLSSRGREGDLLLVTKQCALSSSAILAMCFPRTVQNRLGKEVYDLACASFYSTSSLEDALTAARLNDKGPVVSAMHDVTEGGVLGAVYEMAVASGKGVIVWNDRLPVGPVQESVCRLFGLDPRCCIGAGAMLMAVQNGYENAVIRALANRHIDCVVIGVLQDRSKGLQIRDIQGDLQPLVYQQKDPYWEAFYQAVSKNWL
jgi:hydrogenase maturation factor